jgi:hypothetical protein
MPAHADSAKILAKILKEAAEPRLAASVKKALEKENPAPVAPETRGGNTEKVPPVPRDTDACGD